MSKQSKYKAVSKIINGIKFASTKEANRYCLLKLLEGQKKISDLRLQVNYKLIVNGFLIETYRADFVYILDGKEIVEDTKGFKTKDYIRKKKWMKNILGIEIKET